MKKYLLPLILILLLTFTLIGDCAWLSGWDNRIKLTTDNTKIDTANLTWFPVTVFLTDSQAEEVFNEFDANSDYMKCAFTKADGTTELYAEKELFSFNVSQYPPAQSDTYVKATTYLNIQYYPHFATDPTKSLTGGYLDNSWLTDTLTNQRFHIDLGSAGIVKRVYYENCHSSGANTNTGVENFTFWGSNTGAGTFDDLVYANDEGWTELTVSQNTFDEHVGADQADPKYITVTNFTAYRYYAFKFADNYGSNSYMGVRRIELQMPKAIYHVSRDGWVINYDADTDFYMYYDNDHVDNTTYIGAINTTAGGNVWDGNFKAVYHMVDATTSSVLDSTSNNNDGTKASANNPIETTGKVGQGQDMSSDYIDIASDIVIGTDCTMEAIISADVNDVGQVIVADMGSSGDRGWWFRLVSAELQFGGSDNGTQLSYLNSTNASFSTATYYYVAVIKNNTSATLYKNDTALSDDSGTIYSSYAESSRPTLLGAYLSGTGAQWDGILDEIRYSDTNRSVAWVKATYNSLWDSLLTYGSEETAVVEVNAIFFGANF